MSNRDLFEHAINIAKASLGTLVTVPDGQCGKDVGDYITEIYNKLKALATEEKIGYNTQP
jgi:hypothetical protein